MNEQVIERLQVKTPEQRFLSILRNEFQEPPRVAQALLEEAQACLLGIDQTLRPGQMRVILTRRVLQCHDKQALRRVRILRLLSEAIDQGAAATQEDLAQALHVSVRTIKRDCAFLQSEGTYVPTRGNLQGIGRGQTHKAQIVGRWLQGETYDQIALHTHHCPTSIRRYVQTFVRVVHLHTQNFADTQIASLLGISNFLVTDYLAIYQQYDSPACRQRLAAQIERLTRPEPPQPPKKGAK